DGHADSYHSQIDQRRRASTVGVRKPAQAESTDGHTEEACAEQLPEAFGAEHPFSIDSRTGESDGQEIEAVRHVHEHCDRYRENLVASHRATLQLRPDFIKLHNVPLVAFILLCPAC